jgi:mycothiol synthase
LPHGFSFIHIPDDLHLKTERVNLHRAVWQPSQVTLDAYDVLRESPTYSSDLDVVLVTPEGQFAAYALGWFDPRTLIGIMEPVGTHPSYRGQGLGKLVVREVTRRLARMGAERVVIRTPESNRGAVKLYASSGFKVTGHLRDYQWSPANR